MQETVCQASGVTFSVSEDELRLLEHWDAPISSLSPKERMRLRYTFRNEFSLHRRTCDATQEPMLSTYRPEVEFPVYSNPYFWGDAWDARSYGRDFDFSKTFFENFAELHAVVPQSALETIYETLENSDFCNCAGHLKDCYLIVNSDYSERCLYGKGVNRSFDCLDCFKVSECEACYQTLNSNNCKFSTYIYDCDGCSDCHFSTYLIGCRDCFGCVHLRNKQHCFFNEQLRPEEYKRRVSEWQAQHTAEQSLERFAEFRASSFVKWMQEKNTENCSGDYLVNCKDCHNCYDCEKVEHAWHCSDLKRGDAVSYRNMDVSFYGDGVLDCYQSAIIGTNSNKLFGCYSCYSGNDLYYCVRCVNASRDCFGCQSLKKQQYCILNKQYSREEYHALKDRIISHMKETGEWGKFFPAHFSPYGYNETAAHEYFPLSKDEALAKGFGWLDEQQKDFGAASYNAPAHIEEVPDTVLKETLACEATGRNYRIQKTELAFYRKMGLPLPRYAPQERHRRRMQTRNPRELHQRTCARSGVTLLTTVAPSRKEELLSEEVYLNEFR